MSPDKDAAVKPHPVLSAYYSNESERRQRVDDMFDSSTVYYDKINSIMSLDQASAIVDKLYYEPASKIPCKVLENTYRFLTITLTLSPWAMHYATSLISTCFLANIIAS